ncbi:sensor histidine kinase [Geomesophilobacter sediminis]|uniref:histidine kinase n=1 Tax=Geomesophilobacter sediminis TaxID=2798584 RepID=A0A8J7M262_9BACT|nr:ATP-binding protein [Geomesophilobacter sediminis]MBJ6727134.1 hypothetical protein [Geomesophilobacter sediminis]
MQSYTAQEQDEIFFAGQLIVSADQVSPATKVAEVDERFSRSTELEAMAIVDGDRPVGLITRTKLLFLLSRRFGYELHSRHAIISIADQAPLVVFEDELLDAVIEKACARPPQDIYDEIIVAREDGSFLGLLSLKELVIQQSIALTRNVVLKEVATARSQELERVNQVKSQFLATVTHELRSPVNAIIGLVHLLKMAADQGSMEQIQERLGFLLTTATNLRTVITNILDLSKIEAGKMEVAQQEVDLGALLNEIAETTRVLVRDKDVAVVVTAPGEDVVAVTDPIKLRQIVTNLASNAAKFTEQGRVELRLIPEAAGRTIEVADTGIGIKEEDLRLLFTAFSQVEDAATKSHEGTGLGLAISKNLAQLIGGSISVSSVYGTGTTFRLTLPR